ncbi:MAG: hypothetical protein ACE5EO_04560 [Candidatus Krumholzibacteriia bacterium]
MRNKLLLSTAAMVLAGLLVPALVQAQTGAGIVVFRHTTDLDVSRATDFDGTDDTFDQGLKAWDMRGSGIGFRVAHQFPKLASIHAVAGLAQVTLRDEDITDPNLGLNSRGFDDDVYFSAGARIGDAIPSNPNVFWSLGADFNLFSSDFNEDVTTKWNYDETSFSFDGSLGYMVQGVGFYGGARVVSYSADLEEIDSTRIPGQQTRLIEMERDGQFDLMFGARTNTMPVMGFVEVGLVGSFSATTGFSFRF